MNPLMNRGLEQIPERWRPRLRNFLIYILPVIVGETIRGMLRGDMGMASGMLPALAIWGLTGRIQAVPITWLVLPHRRTHTGTTRRSGWSHLDPDCNRSRNRDSQNRSTATPVQEGPRKKGTQVPTLVRTLPEGGPASQAQRLHRLARAVHRTGSSPRLPVGMGIHLADGSLSPSAGSQRKPFARTADSTYQEQRFPSIPKRWS